LPEKIKIPPTAVGGSLIPTYQRQITESLIPPSRVGGWFISGPNQAAFEVSTNFRWWDLKAGT
jgi:hypothetical protein